MSYTISDDNEYPRITPAVQWLIVMNVAIYFLQITIVSSVDMYGALGFEMKNLEEKRWWTIVTYMFVHGGFWHLLMNMMMLGTFGPRIEHAWSAPGAERRSFVAYYICCGLGGLLFHFVFARNGLLIGASAAILGVMLAYAMRWPDDELLLFFVIPVKVKWMVVFLGGFNLLMGMGGVGGGTAYLAHVGGLIFGWLYLRTPSAQSLDRIRHRVAQVQDVPDEPPRAIPRSLPRPRERAGEVDEIVAKSKALMTKRPVAPVARAVPGAVRADELNAVLDKISERGLESLSMEERRLLEEASRRLKGE